MIHQYQLGGYNIVLDVCSGSIHAVDEIAYDMIAGYETENRETLIAAARTVTDADLERFIIFVEGTRDFNVVDELDKISCPVMAVGVYEDSVLDSDATMEIAEKLDDHADFRLYMYVGYGHAAFDTAPDYRERLLRFFTS